MNFFSKDCVLLNKIGRAFPPPEILRMTALGIDISERAIRYISLKQTDLGKEIEFFGQRELPEGVIKRGDVKNVKELSEIFKDISKETGYKFIRSSLPDERSYLFQTQVPANTEPEEIRTILEFKLEEYVPVSVEDAVFDYTISLSEKNKKDEINISVSVFSKKLIQKYLEAFELAGLVPFSLETDAQAVLRSVIPEGDKGIYLIVNFGDVRTNLVVVGGGIVCFTATLDIGGDDLTEAVKKHHSVSREEAEKIKLEKGFAKNKKNKDLFISMMSVASVLKDEIKRYLSYWHSRMGTCAGEGDEISEIILCGTNASLPGLVEYIEESIKIPTKRANVWVNAFSVKDLTPSIHKNTSFEFATGVGIALRREGKE